MGIRSYVKAKYIGILEWLLGMVDPYDNKMPADQLQDAILTVMPELKSDEECEDGLFRLRLLCRDDYISAGYYLLDGGIMHLTFLSGDDDYSHVPVLQEVVGKTVGDRDGTGYFFVSDAFNGEEDAYDYSHYFVSMP